MTKDQYLSFGWLPNGSPLLRVRVLSWFAALLNVQFKIGGQPYGALYERAINQTEARKMPRTEALSKADARRLSDPGSVA